MNRNERDTQRRNYIKAKTLENLKLVQDDPQSLSYIPKKKNKKILIVILV